MRTIGLTLAWVVGIVYATIPSFWLAIHPFAEKWRSRRGKVYPLMGGIWLAMILVIAGLTCPWRLERFYESAWSSVAGAVFFAFGILTYRQIGRDFGGDKLMGRAEIHPEKYEQRLVTSGMHAKMRHPIYLAHLWMLTAWTVGSGLKVLFVLWVFAIVTGVLMIRVEDKELEARFGDEFREYKKRVRAIGLFNSTSKA
ncbi:MAG: putative protein-S-isoprenylcysteine methyltransferase-like protein [Acidobacteriales bacterium]|nr:putative protein-S-isoprenylcysteine methyltransferase-like protein [Terriglobales bacterium]